MGLENRSYSHDIRPPFLYSKANKEKGRGHVRNQPYYLKDDFIPPSAHHLGNQCGRRRASGLHLDPDSSDDHAAWLEDHGLPVADLQLAKSLSISRRSLEKTCLSERDESLVQTALACHNR